jgi:hypothetical protein
MSANAPGSIIIHADQEHSGVRTAIFLGLFVGLVLGFMLMMWLIGTFAPPAVRDYQTFLSCVGAVPLAVLGIWGLERLLKRVWRSGVSLELNGAGIVVYDHRGNPAARPADTPTASFPGPRVVTPPPPAISWGGNLSQISWYFRLSGYPRAGPERRAPAKWLCLATELHQDGVRLNAFSFMSPERSKPLIDDTRPGFRLLNPTDIYDRSARFRLGPPSRPTLPNTVLHGRDGRYWLAERRRWEYGLELTPDDFVKLIDYARAYARPPAALGAEVESTTLTT